MRLAKPSIAAMCAFIAVAGVAAAEPTPDRATNADADRIFQSYYRDLYAQKFDDALADIKDLSPDASNLHGQAILDAMRAAALLGLKRESQAERLIAEIDKFSPTDPTGRSILFEGSLLSDHFDIAADSIDMLIARFPDAARELDWNLVRYLLAHEPKGQEKRNEDRRVALARIGYGGDSGVGHWRAADAVAILAKRADTAAAGEILQYVKEPEAFENMLVQKRYSALWPMLEKVGGAHLANIRAESLAGAERAYLAAPDDMEKLQAYADALRHSGRSADAIALKSKLPPTPGDMAVVDEKTGWVVNSIAYAFNHAGRIDEGDQLMAMLNDPPRTDASWRVSMIINRLEMLVSAGRFEKAATLLEATERSAANDGNLYSRQLVRRLRYCTLTSLGRKDEARKGLPEMLKYAEDALQPTVEGLLCAGDTDQAEQLVLKALNSPDAAKREQFEEKLVRALQPVPLTDDDPSVWADSWKALRERPAIAAAYEKLGRDLPAQSLPEEPKPLARR